MVTIKHYAIDPRSATQNVRVEFVYAVRDDIAGEDIERGGQALLTDGVGHLASPTWGNDALVLALAHHLGIGADRVSVAEPVAPAE